MTRSSRRSLGTALLAAATVLTVLTVLTAPAGAASVRPADDPRRGVVHEGLDAAPPTGACAGLFEVTVGDRSVCTHGPDAAPDGVDVRQRRAPARAAAPSEGPSPFACFGDGTDGYRIQVIYARAADVPDRFDAYRASFEAWTARVEHIVSASAAETGGVRHVRFQTDPACRLVIDRVVLTTTGDDTFDGTVRDLWAKGYDRTDRRYLVYVDANVYCGLGSLLGDDRGSAVPGFNLNNGNPGVTGTIARVDNGCWGLADSAEAHEVMHTLGGVQPSAPHGTSAYHCADDFDRMCGDDGSGTQMRYLCPSAKENTFDCNHDDYFSTNPPPGSYLATHWNVANSVFLGPSPAPTTPGRSWGFNAYGQLGDGSGANLAVPVTVGLLAVDAVAAGGFHSVAVVGGQVWTWGLGHLGQLGRPWPAAATTPGLVPGLTNVVAVSAGVFHSLALKSDGTVWAWGWNAYGQLGDGTAVDRWQPVRVAGLTGVTSIAAGATHNLARTADGSVWSWGLNASGQLGRTGSPLVAAKVPTLTGAGVTSIAAGGYHSLAVGPGGSTVWAWGWNPWGQLGDGSTVDRAAPVVVSGLTGVASVAAGTGHSLAVMADGTVRSWGLGNTGQLGRVAASSAAPAVVPGLSGVTAVAAGGYHSLALRSGGTVSAWGWNALGQLGDGTFTNRTTPVLVAGVTGAQAVAAGVGHDLLRAPA